MFGHNGRGFSFEIEGECRELGEPVRCGVKIENGTVLQFGKFTQGTAGADGDIAGIGVSISPRLFVPSASPCILSVWFSVDLRCPQRSGSVHLVPGLKVLRCRIPQERIERVLVWIALRVFGCYDDIGRCVYPQLHHDGQVYHVNVSLLRCVGFDPHRLRNDGNNVHHIAS